MDTNTEEFRTKLAEIRETLNNLPRKTPMSSENAYARGQEDRIDEEPFLNPYAAGTLANTLYYMGYWETDRELNERLRSDIIV